MNPQIVALIDRIKALEAELDAELAERRADLRIGLEHGRIVFEQELLRRHRELQVRLAPYLVNARPLVILTTPFIYLLIIPIMLLDACVMLYQAICFPVYGIPKVPRGGFFVFDRAHLAYLNAIEKLNCAYCTYANGVFAYVREIASRTRGILVPDQACQAGHGNARALRRLRGLRRCRRLPQPAGAASRSGEEKG